MRVRVLVRFRVRSRGKGRGRVGVSPFLVGPFLGRDVTSAPLAQRKRSSYQCNH